MGGQPIAAVGYDVTEAFGRYLNEHEMPLGVPSFKIVLRNFESEISMPLSLIRYDDPDGRSRTFLCSYVNYQDGGSLDCEELAAVPVPPQFSRVKELLGVEGTPRRFFSPKAVIFSYDKRGRTRVVDGGSIISV